MSIEHRKSTPFFDSIVQVYLIIEAGLFCLPRNRSFKFESFRLWICFGFRYSNFVLLQVALYICRECSTNQPFFCKTNPISPFFHLKMKISLKNKPNTNPIKANSNPILAQYQGWQSQTKPIQTQTKPIGERIKNESFCAENLCHR